jgi:mRNA interferase MazF
MKKGNIWLVNFDPSLGKEYQKIRPAVVLQSNKINSLLITVMPFSSNLENKQKNDIIIKKDEQNRLFSSSILKVSQISSFDKMRFIHFVGNLTKKNVLDLEIYLRKHFDL